eukprot:15459602-Alexandrium_andersonii.AAC.1
MALARGIQPVALVTGATLEPRVHVRPHFGQGVQHAEVTPRKRAPNSLRALVALWLGPLRLRAGGSSEVQAARIPRRPKRHLQDQ